MAKLQPCPKCGAQFDVSAFAQGAKFTCGACGALQTSSLWHIARQSRCRVCDAFIIVPAPRVRAGLSGAAWRLVRGGPLPGSRGLYCPSCGGHISAADRSRHFAAYCATCQRWF